MRRSLGTSGIDVSAIGMGCWAVGGPLQAGDAQFGWGTVDDDESIRAIRRAHELGVTFFDTASNYGAGHSETILGRGLAGRRDDVVIATKWGWTFDETTRQAIGVDESLEYIRTCLDGCLRRLGTDRIDLYQLHIGELPVLQALEMIPVLDDLVTAGKIRAYGWSTDDPERAEAFAAAGAHCVAIQHDMSVLRDAPEMVALCEAGGVASINRSPLAMGLLSGKYHDGRTVADNDVRRSDVEWMRFFRNGAGSPEWLAVVDSVRDVLTSGGRTLVQGALAWLWARSDVTVPIPGCRTVAQVEENAGALAAGPLSPDEFAQVQKLLGR